MVGSECNNQEDEGSRGGIRETESLGGGRGAKLLRVNRRGRRGGGYMSKVPKAYA